MLQDSLMQMTMLTISSPTELNRAKERCDYLELKT